MKELLGLDAPHLKKLRIEIKAWKNVENEFLFKSFPQLDSLDLFRTSTLWSSVELAQLKFLRLTSIHYTWLNLDQLITLLSSSPILEWLAL